MIDGTHGNADDEGALYVTNWLGSGTINSSYFTGSANDNVRVENNTGVLNRLTITNSTITNPSTGTFANHGLRFATNVATNTGAGVVMNLTVTGTTFLNNRSNHFDSGATGLSTMDLVLNNNTFLTNGGYVTLAGAINITNDHQSDVTFDLNGNSSNGAQLSAVNFFVSNLATAASSMIGKFRNNVIGTTGVTGSGSFQGNGMAMTAGGLATVTVNITGNQIRQFNGQGITVVGGDTSPNLNATITGNTVKEGRITNSLNAIRYDLATTSGSTSLGCVDIGGAGALVQMPSLTGAVDAFVGGRNTVSAVNQVSFTGVYGNNGNAACAQAP